VVVQQVNLIDIEETSIGGGQYTRLEVAFSLLDSFFYIQRADHAIFGGAYRQIHKTDLAFASYQLFPQSHLLFHPV
jgi:hypothetical protein